MRHILLVANQTASSQPLLDAVKERIATGPCEFTLLMPATWPGDSTDSVGRTSSGTMRTVSSVWGGWHDAPGAGAGATPDATHRAARQRLDHALERLRELGASVTGELAPEDALAAITEVTRRHEFDEILISTLPRKISRWLHQDLPSRVRRKATAPVTVVTPK